MKESPIPQGKYKLATRYDNLVFTAGMTPRSNGQLVYKGKVKNSESLDTYKSAVRLAASNALTVAQNSISEDECIDRIISLSVFIVAEDGFEAHAGLADFATEYLYESLGENGIGIRAAIGVATLPSNAPVEIQLIAGICKISANEY